jgi:DivIVA domain-containing protein
VLRRGACHPPVSRAWHDRGVPLLFGILVSAGVIFAIFAVTIGRGGSMTQFQPDWPGQPLPQDRPVRASDLADARFSVAFRGYRMAEVDEALDRLAVEIAQRDERIQQLSGQPFEAAPTVAPEPAAPAAHDPAAYQPAAYDTAVYQPGALDPSAYQPPWPAPQPHGYPPGVLDVGGHPTQPIPPVTDPGTPDPGEGG